MTLLTIGLPVYNAMPFLPETIESLLAQSYSNFTLLIVDDGSTDGSLEYLRTLRDRRIELIAQENRGLTATLNRMLAEANTPWLVRQDADDIAYPDRLEAIRQAIDHAPEAGVFYSYAKYYQKGQSFGSFKTTKGTPQVLSNLTRAGYLLSICHPTTTLNIQKVKAIGGYRFNLHVEDIDLWWRMALSYEMHLIPKATVGFRLNTSSVSSRNLEAQMVNVLYVQYLLLSELWQKTALPFESVRQSLLELIDPQRLTFRKNIRTANAKLGEKRYLSATSALVKALVLTPNYFFERFSHEVNTPTIAIAGENPTRFAAQGDRLWAETSANRLYATHL